MAKAALCEGDVIDGFTLVEKLHKGGMAALWRVTHPTIGAPMLMKAPKLGEGEDPAAIVGFEMEQMILPRLTGKHVPKVFAVGDFAEQPFIVIEAIPGGSLLPLLDTLPLPIEEVTRIGAAVATALDSVHRQHVIHLDVKPSNIRFRPTGEAVLVDFGLSHHAHLPDLMAEEFRLPYGTAPYMAPEQVLGARGYRRSDLFALGAMLYFFTTGVRPFGDPQSLKGLKRRLWRDPVPPRRLRAETPPWLQEIILRCLEPNPEHRYPTAAQLAFDLRHPATVPLSARAEKLRQDDWLTTWRRRANPETSAPMRKLAAVSKIATSPIIAVAIDLAQGSVDLAEALRQAVRLNLQHNPDARVACLNVLKLNPISQDKMIDEDGRNVHVRRLVELKHWAEPLGLEDGRATFHVIEAVNAADAILDYARANHVDHIVMGARAESARRRLLGSVSAEVAAHAPCSVTVVRNRAWEQEHDAAAEPQGETQKPAA
jgi:serine/threonine protein kinase